MLTAFVVQLLSFVQLFVTLWTAACQASLSLTFSQSLSKFTSIKSVMLSDLLILCHLLLLLPSVFPSIRVFSKLLVLHIRWPRYWRFSFSLSPSSDYSGLIFLVFWHFPSVLRCSVLCPTFFPFVFPLCISVWEVSIDKFPSSVIPFLIFVQSNHDQMEDILHFYYFVFDLQNLFLFFLRPSIHIICFCIWSTFFL